MYITDIVNARIDFDGNPLEYKSYTITAKIPNTANFPSEYSFRYTIELPENAYVDTLRPISVVGMTQSTIPSPKKDEFYIHSYTDTNSYAPFSNVIEFNRLNRGETVSISFYGIGSVLSDEVKPKKGYLGFLETQSTSSTITIKSGLECTLGPNGYFTLEDDVVLTPSISTSAIGWDWCWVGINELNGNIETYSFSDIGNPDFQSGYKKQYNALNLKHTFNRDYGYCRILRNNKFYRLILIYKQFSEFSETFQTTSAGRLCAFSTSGKKDKITHNMRIQAVSGVTANTVVGGTLYDNGNTTQFLLNQIASSTTSASRVFNSGGDIVEIYKIYDKPKSFIKLSTTQTTIPSLATDTPMIFEEVLIDFNSEVSGSTNINKIITIKNNGVYKIKYIAPVIVGTFSSSTTRAGYSGIYINGIKFSEYYCFGLAGFPGNLQVDGTEDMNLSLNKNDTIQIINLIGSRPFLSIMNHYLINVKEI